MSARQALPRRSIGNGGEMASEMIDDMKSGSPRGRTCKITMDKRRMIGRSSFNLLNELVCGNCGLHGSSYAYAEDAQDAGAAVA